MLPLDAEFSKMKIYLLGVNILKLVKTSLDPKKEEKNIKGFVNIFSEALEKIELHSFSRII